MPERKEILRKALELRFESDAGKNLRMRDYFCKLLTTLWNEGEGFSGKRPFGNSGWEYEIYAPLIKAGFVTGKLDEFGCVEDVGKDADKFVLDMIKEMCNG